MANKGPKRLLTLAIEKRGNRASKLFVVTGHARLGCWNESEGPVHHPMARGAGDLGGGNWIFSEDLSRIELGAPGLAQQSKSEWKLTLR